LKQPRIVISMSNGLPRFQSRGQCWKDAQVDVHPLPGKERGLDFKKRGHDRKLLKLST
jgi:hypothetical protein